MALQPERAAARAPPAPGRCPATPRWRTGPPRGARQVRRENRRSRRTLRTARRRGEPRPSFRRTPTTTRLTAYAALMAGGLPPTLGAKSRVPRCSARGAEGGEEAWTQQAIEETEP